MKIRLTKGGKYQYTWTDGRVVIDVKKEAGVGNHWLAFKGPYVVLRVKTLREVREYIVRDIEARARMYARREEKK